MSLFYFAHKTAKNRPLDGFLSCTAPVRRILVLCSFLTVPAYIGAQDSWRNLYIIPRTVYVGDRATLTLPLAGRNAAGETDISFDPRMFPLSPDIELYRVSLERRPSGSRLLVEFSAFTPGVLELPPIEIGGERFTGFHVEISSILGPGETGVLLSGPAPPLAIPGTGLLVYGTMSALVLFLLLGIWAVFWGRRSLGALTLQWKRRCLIISMWAIEKHLRRSLSRGEQYRNILNSLSGEFRSFLSFFTGQNCRAMTAVELERLPPLVSLDEDRGSPDYAEPRSGGSGDTAGIPAREPYNQRSIVTGGAFLGSFFRRCDELRFSGSAIDAADVQAVLGDLRRFLKTLDRAGRGKVRRGEAAA